MNSKKFFKRRMIGIMILLTILLAACRPETSPPADQLPTTGLQIPGTGNELPAGTGDQTSGHAMVVIPRVVSHGSGWLAIHAEEGGDIGTVIGFAPVKDGENMNVVVDLDLARATEVLYAVVHMDAGTPGVFEFPGADEPEKISGSMTPIVLNVSPEEAISSEARVKVLDQEIQDGVVEVDEVVSPGSGWLVIHAQDGGSLGPEIGYISVEEGSTAYVTVPVDESRATPVLYAVLHQDAGEIGTYEFPGADVLAEEGRIVIASKFSISPEASIIAAAATQASPTESIQTASTEDVQITTTEVAPATPTAEGAQSMATEAVAATLPDLGLSISDQGVVNESVKVDRVISNQPAWLVIYNQAGREPGEIIGFTSIQEGEQRDVSVEVDASKVTERLYAVLHVDAGTVGEAEFPEPDVPLTNGTHIILASFAVDPHAMHAGAPSGPAPVIEVSDQEIQDGKVRIDKVSHDVPGWLVVYTKIFGQPGEVIGYAPLEAGENVDVSVTIDPGKATEELFAIVHRDAGTEGTFEFPGPDEAVIVGDTPIQASFNTTPGEQASPTQEPVVETPSLMVVDQVIRGGTVKVDSAFLENWGFMTIHNQNAAGAYGPVIGWTPLPKGVTEDIIVNIDASKATETMYAMLHVDDDPLGVLEFPGPDEPVLVMGEVIALPFKVTGGLPGSDLEIDVSGGDSPHLVDTEGMSLYTSLNDSPGVSNCTGDCQKTWLPLLITTGRLVAGDGISSSKLGVITLRNGKRQVTYGGLPLYYYVEDKEPGDNLGHGIEGLWFLATP